MSTAKSLHIGLNFIDPVAYGNNGELANCVNDANSMQALAQAQGFQTTKLTDGQATSSEVLAQIDAAASSLVSGDIYLITYSGHGGQIPDESGQESDGMNETWCLYDRQLIDDELYNLWSRFASGVRIFISSDSCHSGTVVRMILRSRNVGTREVQSIHFDDVHKIQTQIDQHFNIGSVASRSTMVAEAKERMLSYADCYKDYAKRKNMYRSLQTMAGPKNRAQINCSLIFISGCQDNQLSSDGTGSNGLFTQTLLNTWSNGSFNGNHKQFYNDILSVMPNNQTPNFMTLGINIDPFQNQRPYTVVSPVGMTTGASANGSTTATNAGATGGTMQPTKPSVIGPSSWRREGQPMQFTVNRAGNPYFYFEITSDHRLFDYGVMNSEGNSGNFWASWQGDINNRLTGDSFTLPASAWNDLKHNSILYYRIGTTSSLSGWENHKVSVSASQSSSAPSIQVTAGSTSAGTNGTGSTTTGTTTGTTTTGGGTDGLSISASVGFGGENRLEDVRLVQSLLNQLDDATEGGPSPDLVEDGQYGSKTKNAISRFQRANQLDRTGRLEPDGGGFILLKMKARDMILCY